MELKESKKMRHKLFCEERYWMNILKIIVLNILLMNESARSQDVDKRIDSLKTFIRSKQLVLDKVSLSDTATFDAYCDLSSSYHDRGLLDNSEAVADTAVRALEILFDRNGKSPQGIALNRLLARAYTNRGLARLSLSQLESSLKDLIEAESHARIAGRHKLLASILCYQSNCYGSLMMNNEALECLNEAEKISRAYPDVNIEINISSNKAALFTSIQNPDSALFYVEKAIQLARMSGQKYSELVLLLNSLSLGKSLNRFDSFQENLSAAELLLPEFGGDPDWAMFHIYHGFWDVLHDQTAKALIHLNDAYKIVKEYEEEDALKNIYEIKSMLYARQGNWDSSVTYFRKYEEVIIESVNIDRIAEMSKAEAKFEAEKNELLAKEEIQRQRNLKWIAGIGFILISLLAFLLYRMWQRSKSFSIRLAKQNEELEFANQELTRTQHQLIDTEKQRESDRVRMNIARDIHDEIGSGLTKIGMLTELVKRKIRENPTESETQLKRIAEYSRAVNASLSEIVWAVNPLHDSTVSLVEYSKKFAMDFLKESPMHVNFKFEISDPDSQVRPELKRGIFLVLKESLNNALKYSEAQNLDIAFVIEKERFRLKVVDNGIGFNTFDKLNAGNGLLNMQSRMVQLGCHFSVQSELGKGCTIEAWGNVIS